MDFRAAVVVHLLLLAAQASCGVLPGDESEALVQTAHLLRKNLQPVLKSLAPFKASSCRHLNGTELGEPAERPLTGAHLSTFSCYTFKLSNHTPNMQSDLRAISQRLDAIVDLMPGSAPENCSLPDLKGHFYLFQYAWCLLQRLDHRLRDATFDVGRRGAPLAAEGPVPKAEVGPRN